MQQGTKRGGYTLLNDGALPRAPSSYHQQHHPRADGIHLSSILGHMHGYRDEIIPESPLTRAEFMSPNNDGGYNELMRMGELFETGLKYDLDIIYPGRYDFNPVPMCIDGIHMTPDGYDIELDCIAEMKFTLKSAKAAPGDKRFTYFEQQVMSYARADGCNAGCIMIGHYNGEYGQMNDAVYHEWYSRYSQSELDDNWFSILAHLAQYVAVRLGRGKVDPILIDWYKEYRP
jgi:hypothetical protein